MPKPRFDALISVGETLPGVAPPGLLRVAGRALVERQARQAARVGARRIFVLAPALPERVEKFLLALPGTILIRVPAALSSELAGGVAGDDADASLLVIEPGAIVDERVLEAVRDAAASHLLAVARQKWVDGAERIDRESFLAGCLKLPLSQARSVLATRPAWEPVRTLIRATAPVAERLAIEDLPSYSESRRRDVAILWAYPAACGIEASERAILDAAQKGCLDWPARFLHPPVENLLVRWLWPTGITPNLVTLFTGFLGLIALALLALGQFWPGLLIILVIGPLDGVDGKLARTRIEFSRYGDLEHVLDKALEYGWFLAMGWWFARNGHGLAAWLVASGIIAFALIEAIQGEYFRRFAGRQLDDWGPFERAFRLVAGRRNTFFWTLVPFGLAGEWWVGFLAILLYSFLTFLISEWRFLKALAEFGRANSVAVRENFSRTSYAFLSGAGSAGS